MQVYRWLPLVYILYDKVKLFSKNNYKENIVAIKNIV